MKITWFGNASIALETEDTRILIDPFLPLYGAEYDLNKEDFGNCDAVFLTHGHVDHLLSIPEILPLTHAKVYCTKTPTETLLRKGVPESRIQTIAPQTTVSVGSMRITAYQGRHIVFDRPLLRRTLFNRRMLRYCRNLPLFLKEHLFICKENGETLGFLIEAEGKRIFLLGSLGLDAQTDYPCGCDLLVLPYQGASDLITPALSVIQTLRPKAVLPDHFDDAFPPFSSHIVASELRAPLAEKFPETAFILPERFRSITL